MKGTLSVVVPDGGGIQIVVTFDGLPDIPLSEFTLTFDGGPGGLNLVSRSPCDPPPLTFNADFTGQSGQTLNIDVNPPTRPAREPGRQEAEGLGQARQAQVAASRTSA